MCKARVLILGDHVLVLRALIERLNREPDLVVVGKSPFRQTRLLGDSLMQTEDAVSLAAQSNPDVVLMDIESLDLGGFEAARKIRSMQPGVGILFMASNTCDRHIDEAIAIRANGFLTTRAPPEAFVAAVREVASGGTYYSIDVRKRIIMDENGSAVSTSSKSLASRLSARETEVLRHIATGQAQKCIAASMQISVKTVEKHLANLMKKLDIHDRVQLARFAIRVGLVEA